MRIGLDKEDLEAFKHILGCINGISIVGDGFYSIHPRDNAIDIYHDGERVGVLIEEDAEWKVLGV